MLPSNYKSSPKWAKHWRSDSYLCNHIYKWLSVSGPDATCDTKLGASHDNMSSLMLSLVSVRKLRAMIIFHFTLSLWAGEETALVLSNISTKSSVSCDCNKNTNSILLFACRVFRVTRDSCTQLLCVSSSWKKCLGVCGVVKLSTMCCCAIQCSWRSRDIFGVMLVTCTVFVFDQNQPLTSRKNLWAEFKFL